jgi:hypothetical protein
MKFHRTHFKIRKIRKYSNNRQNKRLKRQRKTTGEDAGQFEKVVLQKVNNRADSMHLRPRIAEKQNNKYPSARHRMMTTKTYHKKIRP